MENDRQKEAQESLKFWQEKLNLSDWDLSVELTDFARTDYVQTGHFKVESEKKAVVLISRTPTDKDIHKVVLHEIIHILLWKLDSFCEEKVGPENKDKYLGLLEETVDLLARRLDKKD